jgi:hypothetical protein
VLAADSNERITLDDGSVTITMAVEGTQIPTLNLGNIGSYYYTRPKTLNLVIGAIAFSSEERKNLAHPLITGETLNCEDWKGKVKLDDPQSFFVTCESTWGARTLGEVRTLVLKALEPPPTPSNGPEVTSKPWRLDISTGTIVAIVVVVFVVIAGIIIAVVLVRRKRADKSGEAETVQTRDAEVSQLP